MFFFYFLVSSPLKLLIVLAMEGVSFLYLSYMQINGVVSKEALIITTTITPCKNYVWFFLFLTTLSVICFHAICLQHLCCSLLYIRDFYPQV